MRAIDELLMRLRRFASGEAHLLTDANAIVLGGTLAKFGQNAELRAVLLNTKTRVIAEASPTDRISGIGLSSDDEHAHHPLQWGGLNLLGFALMAARASLEICP